MFGRKEGIREEEKEPSKCFLNFISRPSLTVHNSFYINKFCDIFPRFSKVGLVVSEKKSKNVFTIYKYRIFSILHFNI